MSHPSRTRPALLLLVLLSAALAVAATEGTPAEQGLTVPAGFEIQRVAQPPLVNRPIVADFDEDGRLYVADSSGSNDKVEKQLAERPHRIVRLEDTDGDGVFDASTVFADRMMLPQGTMWLDGSLYVAAPPSIWKLTDTDGDGVADRREEWFEGKTLTTCANDLHGPYPGPDGMIYWTKGAFAAQTYDRAGQPPLVTRAAHIFRRRPGETAVEPVLTGGMDNPVDVAFTVSGERILTATFLEHPRLGRRDAVLHAIYGGVYGKPHAVVDGHPQTGDLMPTLCNLGPAAPAGIARYPSRVFGPAYQDNFFVAQFNMNKVSRHVLRASGATFTTRDSDFVVSDSRDFHPTDVVEDADGSLLVVDTGAWYKLCCPTSQLAKPDVLGAIYRIRRKAAPAVRDPRGRALGWPTLTDVQLTVLLDDPRPAVHRRAVHAFASRGSGAIPVLHRVVASSTSPTARLNAVWALTRIADQGARAATHAALADRDLTVRQAASTPRPCGATPARAPPFGQRWIPVPAVQRVAAEALGRIGDAAAVPELLATAARPLDRALEHSVTYALIEIANPAATRSGLSAASARTRRAALVALDQMGHGALQPTDVVPLLAASDQIVRDTAWWVAAHHPEWGEAFAEFFARELAADRIGEATGEDLQEKLAQFGRTTAVQALIARTARDGTTAARVIALRAMALSRLEQLADAWVSPVVASLGDREPTIARHAVAVLRAAPPSKDAAPRLREALVELARTAAAPPAVRLDALLAVGDGLESVAGDLFDFLRASLEPEQPAGLRMAAAGVIEKARLDRAQLLALATILRTSGSLELPRLLPAFDHSADDEVGLALIEALTVADARGSVRPEVLRPRVARSSARAAARRGALRSARGRRRRTGAAAGSAARVGA